MQRAKFPITIRRKELVTCGTLHNLACRRSHKVHLLSGLDEGNRSLTYHTVPRLVYRPHIRSYTQGSPLFKRPALATHRIVKYRIGGKTTYPGREAYELGVLA